MFIYLIYILNYKYLLSVILIMTTRELFSQRTIVVTGGDREIVIQWSQQGVSGRHIAERLNCSINTLKQIRKYLRPTGSTAI